MKILSLKLRTHIFCGILHDFRDVLLFRALCLGEMGM
jgi:hypothetical protein